MNSIVEQLSIWAKNNSQNLEKRGFQVIEKFPTPDSASTWKASIGLIYEGVLVSYTVWERSSLQTELIVMNALTERTILMDDKNPDDPGIVHSDLDAAVRNLLDNTYKNMTPDPKLTIT